MKEPKIKTKIAIFALITVANILLAHYAALNLSAVPGVVTFYFAIAFMAPFTLWFGIWGVIASYIGCLVGAGTAAGFPLAVNLYWSFADVWQVLIPLVAFRALNANAQLISKRDIGVFLVFGWLLSNFAGAIWGTITLMLGNQAAAADFYTQFTNWFIGNLIVTILITPLLLKLITPVLKRKQLLIHSFW